MTRPSDSSSRVLLDDPPRLAGISCRQAYWICWVFRATSLALSMKYRRSSSPLDVVVRAWPSGLARISELANWRLSGPSSAAEEHGLRVPEDVTVVGYDNIYTSTINRVSLTSVDESGHLTGMACVRLLLERINGRSEPKQFVVTPQLVIRRTSGLPARAAEAQNSVIH